MRRELRAIVRDSGPENKVLLSFFLSLPISFLLASRWTLYARRVSCQRSRLRHLCRPSFLPPSLSFSLSFSLFSYPSCHLSPLPSLFHPSFNTMTFYFFSLFFPSFFCLFASLFCMTLHPATLFAFQFSFLTHSLPTLLCDFYYSQPCILESTPRKSLPKATGVRPLNSPLKSPLFPSFILHVLSHFSLTLLCFIFCFFLFHLYWFFQLLQLVCTVYLLNILFVLFQRGLPQINKLISSLSFYTSLSLFLYFFIPLILTFDLYLFSLGRVLYFGFRRIVGVRGGERN